MRGFLNIGFAPDASETAEAMLRQLYEFTVEVTPSGDPFASAITGVLIGFPERDGEVGLPVTIRRVNENGEPYGDPERLDAVHVYVL